MNTALTDRPPSVSQRLACKVLALSRSHVRAKQSRRHFCGPPKPAGTVRITCHQPRQLSEEECSVVLNTLNSEAFYDQPPAQVYHTLLSRRIYLCSISTMHRLLRQSDQSGERRKQRPGQTNAVPRLSASQPNEVWTWDITKLATVKRGVYLSLYVVMDLFSRYIVAWMLSHKENSALAQQLIQEASTRYAIRPNQLTLHQDRGAPMTAHCYLDLLGELAVTASHSRPRVSNDNPHSESQFRTLKYQPDYPRRFDSYSHANGWCTEYIDWYNHQHCHSALEGFTPCQVFTGQYIPLSEVRQQALNEKYVQHAERFVNQRPVVRMPPAKVYINPVRDELGNIDHDAPVNFPTLNRAKYMVT